MAGQAPRWPGGIIFVTSSRRARVHGNASCDKYWILVAVRSGSGRRSVAVPGSRYSRSMKLQPSSRRDRGDFASSAGSRQLIPNCFSRCSGAFPPPTFRSLCQSFANLHGLPGSPVAAEGWRRRDGAKTCFPRTGKLALHYLPFTIPGDVANARAKFGSLGAKLSGLAHIAQLSVAQNMGTGPRFGEARNAAGPHLARECGNAEVVRDEFIQLFAKDRPGQ